MGEDFRSQLYVRSALNTAIRILWSRDADLLSRRAQEEAIAHRLAIYLELFFPTMHVDCEYNRDGDDPKRVGHLRRPDIIIHRRGTLDNLLAVELKCDQADGQGRKDDIAKLRSLRQKFRYSYTASLLVTTDEASTVWENDDREELCCF